MALSKNQGRYRGKEMNPFYLPDEDCLPRYNYSTGAGWRTKNLGHIKRNWSDGTRNNRGKIRRCGMGW